MSQRKNQRLAWFLCRPRQVTDRSVKMRSHATVIAIFCAMARLGKVVADSSKVKFHIKITAAT